MIKNNWDILYGRHGRLMVSGLDSGSNGPGLRPGWGTALCSWARHFTLVVSAVIKFLSSCYILGITRSSAISMQV